MNRKNSSEPSEEEIKKLHDEIRKIFKIFTDLHENYQKNINASVKNHTHLKAIFNETIEKYSTVKKRLEKLERLLDENKVKNDYDTIKNSERNYAEKTISISNLEKNFIGNLFKNIVNQNEEEVKKNQKVKNALMISLANSLRKVNLEEIKSEKTLENIKYLKDKYKKFFEENLSARNIEEENMAKLKQVVGRVFFLFFFDQFFLLNFLFLIFTFTS